MYKYIRVICFALLSFKVFCENSCPLDFIKPSQNLTQMIGTWHEYKKTTDFLANNMCTTYNVMCPNNGKNGTCNVHLLPNGTNTGYTNTLIVSGTSTMWGYDKIYLNVDSTQQFAILWNCKMNDEIKKYYLVALVRDLSDEDTIKKIDTLLDETTVKYQIELETINNTLCSSAMKSTLHNIMLLILVLTILHVLEMNSYYYREFCIAF